MAFCLPQDGVGMESWGDAEEERGISAFNFSACAGSRPPRLNTHSLC